MSDPLGEVFRVWFDATMEYGQAVKKMMARLAELGEQSRARRQRQPWEMTGADIETSVDWQRFL